MKKIIIVAGEPSGDLYGGLLAEKLKTKFPSLDIFSFAGPKLAKHSNQLINLLDYSVSGIIEVLSHLRRILKVFKEILQYIHDIKPDLIILIDFPDFNLRLAKTLNKKFPIFYYISPQVWAWRKKRISLIKQLVEKIIVIFKFEEKFYQNEGIDALYFGHPLLDVIKKQGINTKKIISLLPGSRKNEIQKHLLLMQQTKTILQKELPDYSFRILKPQNIEKTFYEEFPLDSDIEIADYSYRAIEESKFIIASSGTATVEIAILEIPYIIIYKVNPISWYILKRLVKTDYIGMVNILQSRKVVTELLQTQATPDNIAKASLKYLKNPQEYSQLKSALGKTKEMLSPYGATEKFTDFIAQYLELKNSQK